MGNNIQKSVRSVFNPSEADKHPKENYLKEILDELMSKNRDTAMSLRDPAERLDHVQRECQRIHVAGTLAGITGGVLIIAGGIASKMTFRAATPALALGIGTAAAAAGTNLTASFVEASTRSKEIKKAEMHLKEALNNVTDDKDAKQKFLDGKEYARLLFIVYLVDQIGGLSEPVKKLLQQFVFRALNLPSSIIKEVSRGIEKAEIQVGPQGKKLAAGALKAIETGAQVARREGAQVARRVRAQRAKARRAGAQLARLAGAQAAVNIPQVSAIGASRLIIGMSVAFMVWDAIDLGLTFASIIENRGSETAKFLRQKADGLEHSSHKT